MKNYSSKYVNNMGQKQNEKALSFFSPKNVNYLSSSSIEEIVRNAKEKELDIVNNVEDKLKLLTSVAYGTAGNIVGKLVNALSLMQDALLYSDLETAKTILVNMFNEKTVGLGSREIKGFTYANNEHSPILFDIPVITSQGYRTVATVLHAEIANNRFIDILQKLDVEALTEIDMKVLANDIAIIARTSELAIDVAKDKSIKLVNADKWLNSRSVQCAGAYLKSEQGEWKYAKDTMHSMIKSRAKGDETLEKYDIVVKPESASELDKYKIVTSSSLAAESAKQAVLDFMNQTYGELLSYAKTSELVEQCTVTYNNNIDLQDDIKSICSLYKQYSVSVKLNDSVDSESRADLNKILKDQKTRVIQAARNNLAQIGLQAGVGFKTICEMVIGYFLQDKNGVMQTNAEDVKALLPNEFALLYSGVTEKVERQDIHHVDEIIEELLDEGHDIKATFVRGIGYQVINGEISEHIIAKTSFKYNAENVTLVIDEEGDVYAELVKKIEMDTNFGDEMLIRVSREEKRNLFFANDHLGEVLEFVTARPRADKGVAAIRENVVAVVREDGSKVLGAQFKAHPYTALSLCSRLVRRNYKGKSAAELKKLMNDVRVPLPGKIVINDTLLISNNNSKSQTTTEVLVAFVTVK